MKHFPWHHWTSHLALWSYWLIVITLGASFVLGLLAALLGGIFTHLGDGFGGAWSVPPILLSVALLLSLPSLILSFVKFVGKPSDGLSYFFVYLFAVLIWLSYPFLAHALDPCFLGLWQLFSKLGSIRLCEQFGAELNIHTRFHLLWHTLPCLPILGTYWVFNRRLNQ